MRVAGVAKRLLKLSARDPLSEEIGRHLWVLAFRSSQSGPQQRELRQGGVLSSHPYGSERRSGLSFLDEDTHNYILAGALGEE